MPFLPLISHSRPDQVIAWHQQQAITAQTYLADVAHLAALLPSERYVLNVCRDRYRFAVGLGASILAGKVSLLPPSHTPDMVEQLVKYTQGVFCLHDSMLCDLALPKLSYPQQLHSETTESDEFEVPQIDASQLIAVVFTSGSTGAPVPHEKHWGKLVQNVQAQAGRLNLPEQSCLVGTIPPQHMYGFESTILLPLLNGHVLHSDQPFYPADIVKALADGPSEKVLVSTPLHLRLLLDAGIEVPPLQCIVSATAPLSGQLAQKLESTLNAPLLEIYGSTETGQIASRRSTHTEQWQLMDHIRLTAKDDRVWADGGHIEKAVPLNDIVEITDATHFTLHGRTQDLINIAGKRNSLAHLNHLLTNIPGVLDGSFYMPDETSHDTVTRLAACVVAPGLSPGKVMAALRESLDPVFLPRPLLFVEKLPRNSTGKLPRQALQQLFAQAASNSVVNP